MQQETPTITIRKAARADAPGILACLRSAFEEFRSRYTPAAFLDTVLTPESIHSRLESMTVFVALDALGKVAGTIACAVSKNGEGHLRGMAVLPSLRGAGVAARLLNAAEAELRRNCTRITLDTTEPLERAMRFYEKHGYRRSGKITDFFEMPLIEYENVLSR